MNHNKNDCAEFQYHPHDKLPILGKPFPLLAITIAHTKSLYHNLCQKNLTKTQSYLNIPIQELKTILTLTCLPPQNTTPQSTLNIKNENKDQYQTQSQNQTQNQYQSDSKFPNQNHPLKPNVYIATNQNAEPNQTPEPSHQALTQNITSHPIIKNQNQHQSQAQYDTNSKSPNQIHPLKPNVHIATTQNAELNQTPEPSHQIIQNTSPIFACPHPKLGKPFPLTYIEFTHIRAVYYNLLNQNLTQSAKLLRIPAQRIKQTIAIHTAIHIPEYLKSPTRKY